jgi:23S rRNA (cytidine1920-2'-O)/16S rRNA (cytidine1409-2'-O)-methyltransferase
VRDNVIHTTICSDIARFMRSLDWQVGSIIASPITGGDGNQEFFIEARRG